MPKNILLAAAAVLGFGSIMASGAPAQAQVGLEIGPGGVRVYEDRPHRPVVERRRVERRVIVEDEGEDCRVEVRRRINRFGEREVRRVTICE
ncbi:MULTISPECIES: hypothetical protein [Microvirga]|uniref:hypothetical protein n=1 Tax=Microvirga TaxID=186650 RepID=UPI001CFC91CF|nr:hypothetical protein [Microvirga lenta]MCB5174547.1 hypothetical protein [Microvirga lenta]